MRIRNLIAGPLAVLVLSGCISAQQHRTAVSDPASDRLTVGTVQREIRIGMTAAEVVEVLGSPNMVTTDELRRETWVYDKVATETVQSSSDGGTFALLLWSSQSAGARSTSQRTLTIIIKYDEQGRVRDFSYRSSAF